MRPTMGLPTVGSCGSTFLTCSSTSGASPASPTAWCASSCGRRAIAPCITLTHRMLGVGHAAGYGAGWHAHLDVLEAAMVGGALSWDERFGEIIGDYQTRFTPPSPATTSTGTPDADGASSAATTTGQTEP